MTPVIGVLGLSVATYIAFVIIAAVVVVLAGYLIAVAYMLKKVSSTLDKVLGGVRAITDQTTPVEYVLAGIASDVTAIQNALRGLLPAEEPVRRLTSSRRARNRMR